MKIGIKYCGGCNPTYSREKIEEYIRKKFEVVYTSDPGAVDVLVCICGCKRACVLDSLGGGYENVLIFDEEKSEDEVIKKIKEYLAH